MILIAILIGTVAAGVGSVWLAAFLGFSMLARYTQHMLSLAAGALVYVFLMRKMTGEMVLAAILTTVALGILIRGVIVLVWSSQQQYPAQALAVANTSVALPGGARISFFSMLLVITTALVYGALLLFLRFGRWGIRMRAAGQSPLLAAQRGINLHAVYALAWGLSTLTGALAGILIALDSALDQGMVVIGLKAFPAALVGGLDSLLGTLIGALIIAIMVTGLIMLGVNPFWQYIIIGIVVIVAVLIDQARDIIVGRAEEA